MVANTLEQISEPAQPRRNAMQAGGRGQSQSGGSQEQSQTTASRQSGTQSRSSRSTGNES